ncbi:calcitonin gene-related peptide type 1 receptor-like isoform X3 [Limulus polyphemus]|uniref:Calcitonin gene-related peptide type 1 receptor-like isoform X3 n=1 Tax=Limulus polyphemus TaxID=6850 RepID=A0ABM1T3D7_LIMPO|nr:calcitonin gene-related peptide type 1 receptor-like isoform X3 [Limulus polyphemus]
MRTGWSNSPLSTNITSNYHDDKELQAKEENEEPFHHNGWTNSTDQNGTRTLSMKDLCYLQYRDKELNKGVYCDAIWDSFYCWPTTPAGKVAVRSCSEIFIHNEVPISVQTIDKAHAYRVCSESGDWLWGEWTNYTECLELLHQDNFSSDQIAVTYILFIGSLVSLLSLILTLCIFCHFKSLHCPRLHVHQNLVIALIIHSILLFIISTPGVLKDPTVFYRNIEWLCKAILSVKMYAAMASINWMFVEGLLLHSRITVSIFNMDTPFKLYYFIGWDQHLLPCEHCSYLGYETKDECIYRDSSSEEGHQGHSPFVPSTWHHPSFVLYQSSRRCPSRDGLYDHQRFPPILASTSSVTYCLSSNKSSAAPEHVSHEQEILFSNIFYLYVKP